MRRRSLRKAVRNGVVSRPAHPGELASLLDLALREAYGAHDETNPYPPHTGRLVEEWGAGREGFAVFTGLVEGEPAGVVTVVAQHGTALFWVGATLRRFQRSGVNDLLYQSMLEWAVQHGCRRMDLCGSVDEGIRRYKLSFGGEEQPYLVVESAVLPQGAFRAARSLLRVVRRTG
jgi:GNAT superfamily N-acetyltransferase